VRNDAERTWGRCGCCAQRCFGSACSGKDGTTRDGKTLATLAIGSSGALFSESVSSNRVCRLEYG
jgi:hypothetical protein